LKIHWYENEIPMPIVKCYYFSNLYYQLCVLKTSPLSKSVMEFYEMYTNMCVLCYKNLWCRM